MLGLNFILLLKIIVFSKVNYNNNLVLHQIVQTRFELCILPLCLKIMNNKFCQLGLYICNKLRWKGHVWLELNCMSITSIIKMTHKNILKPLPRYELVIIGIHLQMTKLQLWNTTTIALPLYARLVILIMFKFGIENQVTHGPYSKKKLK
jgi:hypothetical protein